MVPCRLREHRAARERVVMIDQTAFAKFEIKGPGALDTLNWISSNQMDRTVGRVTYTSLLNKQGKIKCDLTITRLDSDRFLIVTGGSFAPHDLAWIKSHLPDDGSVSLTDVSSSLCCIGLWGPRARDLAQSVTSHNLSNEILPLPDWSGGNFRRRALPGFPHLLRR